MAYYRVSNVKICNTDSWIWRLDHFGKSVSAAPSVRFSSISLLYRVNARHRALKWAIERSCIYTKCGDILCQNVATETVHTVPPGAVCINAKKNECRYWCARRPYQMLRVFFYKKNIILVNKLTYLLSGAFLSAKIVKGTNSAVSVKQRRSRHDCWTDLSWTGPHRLRRRPSVPCRPWRRRVVAGRR